MKQNWPTKEKDLQTAQLIMEEYANHRDTEGLGLLEIVVNQANKRMDFRLSGWVMILAKHFNSVYGTSHGDFVTRQIISRCITREAVIH